MLGYGYVTAVAVAVNASPIEADGSTRSLSAPPASVALGIASAPDLSIEGWGCRSVGRFGSCRISQEARAARTVCGRIPRLVDRTRLLAICSRPVSDHAGAPGTVAGAQRARGRSAQRRDGEHSWPSIGSIAGGCRERASGRCLSICAPGAPFRPSRPRWWRRLSSWSASTASGWFASAGWRRSRSAPASRSPGSFSPDASTPGIRAACWGSRPARSMHFWCASARE